jgi:acetylornithine/N-succinyldiaminopimelate aminotransferase
MITVGAGDNVVRLLPPLIIGESEVSESVRRIERACRAIEREAASAPRAGVAS